MTDILLETILQDTFIKTLALKKIIGLKDHLLHKVFALGVQGPPPPEITIWVENLNPTLFSGINQQNIYRIFDKLEKDIKAIEPLVLYLPYDLPGETIAGIGQTLRQDYGQNFLIEIQIDPGLVAGAALSYKGIYKDYSVKHSIFLHRKEILDTFRKYIKH